MKFIQANTANYRNIIRVPVRRGRRAKAEA